MSSKTLLAALILSKMFYSTEALAQMEPEYKIPLSKMNVQGKVNISVSAMKSHDLFKIGYYDSYSQIVIDKRELTMTEASRELAYNKLQYGNLRFWGPEPISKSKKLLVSEINAPEAKCVTDQIKELVKFNTKTSEKVNEALKKLNLKNINISLVTLSPSSKEEKNMGINGDKLDLNLTYTSAKGCNLSTQEEIEKLFLSFYDKNVQPIKDREETNRVSRSKEQELLDSLKLLSTSFEPKASVQRNLAVSDNKEKQIEKSGSGKIQQPNAKQM